jgi:hypothetical protein
MSLRSAFARSFATLAAALTAAVAPPAQAQMQKLTPGLWEMQMKSGDSKLEAAMTQMREQMANMPPEQRKMMEEMLSKQGVALGAGGARFRFCMSKEQAERQDFPQDHDNNCKRESLETSANTMRFAYTCTNPPGKGRGEVTMVNSKSYTMKLVGEHPGAQGKMEKIEMQQSAQWIGADCGALKPVGTR